MNTPPEFRRLDRIDVGLERRLHDAIAEVATIAEVSRLSRRPIDRVALRHAVESLVTPLEPKGGAT